jgi:hypothetical protein
MRPGYAVIGYGCGAYIDPGCTYMALLLSSVVHLAPARRHPGAHIYHLLLSLHAGFLVYTYSIAD